MKRPANHPCLIGVVAALAGGCAWARSPAVTPAKTVTVATDSVLNPTRRAATPAIAPTATVAKPTVIARQVDTSSLPAAVLDRAKEHLTEGAVDLPAWQGASLATKAQPLYRPDLVDVAYYHLAVTNSAKPAGFMILSAGGHDMPVVQWSESAESPIKQLDARALQLRRAPFKYYMLDLLSFAVEDERGQLIATLGELPSVSMRGLTAPPANIASSASWKERKNSYASTFASTLALLRSESAKAWEHEIKSMRGPGSVRSLGNPFACESWKYHWAGDHEQRWYSQIDANQTPNTSACSSGCGATAWAMLFGWADFKAAQNAAPWQYSKGLYRENGGSGTDVEAPKWMDTGVKNMTWEIRNHIQTECASLSGGQGRTWPWNMEQARKYLSGRSAAQVQVEFYKTANLIPSFELRDKADAAIKEGRPVILALGVQHYVLAYGYRKKTCPLLDKHDFKINEGWALGEGRWTSANTWFVGQLRPAPDPNASTAPEPQCPNGQRCCEPLPRGRCLCKPNSMECP